jgi:hypothetical protein
VDFFRVVEVFPPLFPLRGEVHEALGLEDKMERFVEDIRAVRDLGDLFLVANLKDPSLLKLSTVEAAFLLQDRIRVRAAPVLVVRDMNRLQFLSTAVTAIYFELDSLMVAWGDSYPASTKVTNVRDFPSLGRALHEVNSIRRQARSPIRLLAPVDLNRLRTPKGIAQAKERLRAGADFLLAQPPTTDATDVFDSHAALLKAAGLEDRVLLNVFPFTDGADMKECEDKFGWRLPRGIHEAATAGSEKLRKTNREVVARLRDEGFPGVYLSTRGSPSVAATLFE